MEKIINIDGRDVKFKTSGAFAKRYKAQFKRDAIKDVFSIQRIGESLSKGEKIPENIDTDIIYDIVWAFAKNANPDITEPIEWFDSFDEFPVLDVLVDIMDLITASFSNTAEIKKTSKKKVIAK